MYRFSRWVFASFFIWALTAAVIAQEVGEITVVANDSSKSNGEKKDKKKKKDKDKPFEEVIEDFQKIEGLFTFYHNKEDEKVYLEIRPAQLGKTYLMNITREGGEGYIFDGGAMLGEFPFFFKKVGKKIQLVEKNLRFRADKDAAISRAIARDIPNSIWASAKLVSAPHPETGGMLIDASEFFLKDVGRVSYLTGRLKMGYSMDKGNSYFSELKSFPLNSEIEVSLHFTSSNARGIVTLANSRSMMHRYHYSIAEIPESDYQPRLADDRVGHFVTMFQDYNSALRDDPYERYVTRWPLEKAEPKFKTSKPKKPIVYWLENTIPVEYRDAIREGVLVWNSAFERIGFKDAIEVRQMPDDAEWDPADARYNTVRWIISPGAAYAVGPSRANPYNGEIYDADIRISADFVRAFFNEFDEFVKPNSWKNASINDFLPGMLPSREPGAFGPDSLDPAYLPYQCQFGRGFMHQFRFGTAYLQSQGRMEKNSPEMEKFIHDALVNLVAHEVGHTLGLRHNFKASAVHSLEEISAANFDRERGLTGSMMDYAPVNLAKRGSKQGAYYQTSLGDYDYWAIEYAYKPYDPDGGDSEKDFLDKIARRASESGLRYGTDEDAFGLSVRSIDPTCNLWDIGSDPLAFYQLRLDLTRDLWQNMSKEFSKKGERYPKFREVFTQGIIEYALAGMTASKFIGGIYQHRDHIGDPNGRLPLQIVPAKKQREALDFLVKSFFSPNSFQFSPELLNKLAPERNWDFEGTVFYYYRLDYPIHGMVQLLQAITMFRLYDPLALARLQDNEIRFTDSDKFTMAEQFTQLREAIWQEVAAGQNVNSFRRELQRMHIYVLDEIAVKLPVFYPRDAGTLARFDLTKIKTMIEKALTNGNLDTYTIAHLQESAAKIDAILNAQMRRVF